MKRVAMAVAVGFGLACGGFEKSSASTRMVRSLEAISSLPDGPSKATLTGWIEQGYVQAQEGTVSRELATTFREAVEAAASDGEVDADELAGIGAIAKPFATPGPASPERDALLEKLRTRALEASNTNNGAAAVSYGVASWDLNTLETHAKALAAGGPVTCEQPEQEGIPGVMRLCVLPEGLGTVMWQQLEDPTMAEILEESMGMTMAVWREGNTLVLVQYNGGGLVEPLVAKWAVGTPQLEQAWVDAAITPDGLTGACNPMDVAGEQAFSCVLSGARGESGMIVLTRKPGAADVRPTPAGGGTVRAVVGEVELLVSYVDPDAGGTVLRAVLTGEPLTR